MNARCIAIKAGFADGIRRGDRFAPNSSSSELAWSLPLTIGVSGPQTYRDLTVWQVSVDLVEAVYRATEKFPRGELFGLVSQMLRAAVSVTANIAEGNSRYSTAAYVNHISIALGSIGELGALLEVSRRLAYLPPAESTALQRHVDEVGRLLSGLRAALKRRLDTASN